MSVSPKSPSVSAKLLAQELLRHVAGVVPFAGRIRQGKLLVELTPALRTLLAVPPAPARLVAGPLLNRRVAPGDIATNRAALDRLLATGAMDVEYRMLCEGDWRTVRLVARVLPGSTRVVGVLREGSVDTRTEQQLHATQERLQSLGRVTLLGEVASGLAHELNQPLAAITTFAQAGERLLQMPEPRIERAAGIFKDISQQALRAGDTLRHMRSLIKRRAPQTERLTAEQLMKDFLVLAEPVARVNQVQLHLNNQAGTRMVLVDAGQIHQALMILFQNAVEASRQAAATQPQVRVEVGDDPSGTGLELAVIDQGPGVSAEVAGRLFQPFFSTKEQGTGLGLVSCRNILEAHGSRLGYDNLAGGGCRFAFVIPYAPS